jgi:pre-mRNA-splicing helicase BRR2
MALMVDRRMWRSQSPLRQFSGSILDDILVRLERRDFPWERMWDLNSQEIGELIRVAAKGKDVHRLVHMFPTLRLTAHVQPVTRSTLRVELTITPDFNWSDKHHGQSLGFWVAVEDGDGERILYHQYFLLKKKFAQMEENDHLLEFHVPMLDPLPPQYFVRIFSDRWLGSETVLPISLMNLIPPAKYPPHDEMLDLRPTAVTALEKPEYISIYSGVSKTFNPLQTQTFNALYKSDGNVLVAASTGSGIEVCGELAILHTLAKGGKVVYVCPVASLCSLRKRTWEKKFGVPLEKLVLELTGDTATDLKLLELGHIIISTPENWDRMSRRWKKRKPVQEVDLFLVDQLHLLNADNGHILEVIVSRMRFISSRLDRPIRIVALSASIANARDVGEWIGASKAHTFNFHPTVRPVTLEMHLQGFDNVHFAPRLTSMGRPMIQTVQRTPVDKPIVVFVHARSQALTVAMDLKHMCDGLPEPGSRFRLVDKEELERLVDPTVIKNSAHRAYLLEYGIAIYHENMSAAERDTIETIYQAGLISCVLVSREMCWSMPFRAYLVIIAGTEYYDGKEHRYIEYPVSDVLQMVGMAGRQGQDHRGTCMLFCYTPRKEFYKRYLFESLPLESQLDSHLHNHMNSEIVTRTIANKQDSVDYITWTFLYRRLTQNPNYYNLTGTTHRHLSDFLSQLIEDTINDLTSAGMVMEEDDRLSALNPGIISAYYYISYVSMDLFVSSLTAKTKMRGLMEVVAAASEFDEIPVRQHEAGKLRKLAAHLPMKLDSTTFTDGRSKINVLLQAHFSRFGLTPELAEDQKFAVVTAHRLMQAVVDIVSSEGWLGPALAGQELSQMLVQGMWDNDSHLLQLPHLGDKALAAAKKAGVETIYDFQELEDKSQILAGLTKRQMADVATVSNRYPEIEVAFAVQNEENLTTSDPVSLVVQLEREFDESAGVLGPVPAPLFPKEQAEGWWLVIGTQEGVLLGIKRVSFGLKTQEKIDFMPPTKVGEHELKILLMSDSFIGCDQEFELVINLAQGDDDDEEDDSDQMDVRD